MVGATQVTFERYLRRFAADHPEKHKKSSKPKNAEPAGLTLCQLRGWEDLHQVAVNIPLLINWISLTSCSPRCSWSGGDVEDRRGRKPRWV